MPYVDIKCFPRSEEAAKQMADKIYDVLLETWECPPHGISVSIEMVTPEEWDEKVKVPEMDPRDDTMLILHGEKRYQPAAATSKG